MLRVALVYPELLGTYGDGGNALVLVERARRRGLEATQLPVALDTPLPEADIYLLGGGEDGPQRHATEALRRDGTLGKRIEDGAVLFAVCAGLQIVGVSFEVEGGEMYDGLALVDLTTRRDTSRRVGELRCGVGTNELVGFENHGGVSALGNAAALGTVRRGFGNDGLVDGCRAPRLVGTYAHGPVLALNPWLADELLGEAVGHALEPLVTVADQLYDARRRAR